MPEPYAPRRPADTVLHGAVTSCLPTFLAKVEAADRFVPAYVKGELSRFLDCGDPAKGFTWLECGDCGVSRFLPFSCKGRGFCPSCGGRRMEDLAAHLVDRVLPKVPIRQWVLTVPFRMRWVLARRADLRRAVLDVFVRAVFGWQRRRARDLGRGEARSGAVTVEQRFGSALNLNPHFHTLIADGVWVDVDGEPMFRSLPAPKPADVARLVTTVRSRVLRLLKSRGARWEDDVDPDDAQGMLQLASMTGQDAFRSGRPTSRARGEAPVVRSRRRFHGALDGFDLDAGVGVRAHERGALRRLCRYLARPALGNKRLSQLGDGTIAVTLKTPWRDGTTHLFLSGVELVGRLAALVPEPRVHLVHYHGVFGPAAKGRSSIVQGTRPRRSSPKASLVTRAPWCELLRRTFAVDALLCLVCGGRMVLRALVPEDRVTAVLEAAAAQAKSLRLPWPPRAGPWDVQVRATR